MSRSLPTLSRDAISRVPEPFSPQVLAEARAIVERVEAEGESAIRAFATEFGERGPNEALIINRTMLDDARDTIDPEDRVLLERTADRITRFAQAQRDSLRSLEIPVPGGVARQVIEPVESAGCYAPGGRYPLPSSVLMTAVTARVAGVDRIIVASPKPTAVSLAAASIAGADAVLAIGGAHSIAALAFGVCVDPIDVIAGPGNAWVTAAKYIVSNRVRIDMLAGPSELVVVADDSADPEMIAADLLAQAEHDVLARPILIAMNAAVVDDVDRAIATLLADLSTADVASRALQNGGAIVAQSDAEAIELCNLLAPEHLQLSVHDPSRFVAGLRHYGGLFIGEQSAEVLGDYGAGPNHTLPTGGTARQRGGLCVFDFLKIQTQLEITDRRAAATLVQDADRLADLEGLAGHALAARMRISARAT